MPPLLLRWSLVPISFYALSLLFGLCRLPEFTLEGPLDWGSWMVSMTDNSLKKSIVCQVTVTTEDSKPDETYVGLTENTFKTCFANHKASFNNPSKRMRTELSKHMYGTLKTTALTSRSLRRFWSRLSPTTPLPNGVIYVCRWSILLSVSRIRQHLTSATNLYLRIDTVVNFCYKIPSPLLLHNRIYGNGIVLAVGSALNRTGRFS